VERLPFLLYFICCVAVLKKQDFFKANPVSFWWVLLGFGFFGFIVGFWPSTATCCQVNFEPEND